MRNYNSSQTSRNLSRFQTRHVCLFCILFVLLATIESAHAHKVNIFAYVEGDTIFTESYFNDGKKCVNSIVTVLDEQGNKLLAGKTDKDGLFSFKIPQHTDLSIVLLASMGHRAEYILKKAELSDSESATEPVAPAMPSSLAMDQRQEEESAVKVDMAQLQSLIEESLDKKLAPIKRMLTTIQQDHGPSLSEVIGGIGYIFGIMGLVLFFRSKRNK